MRKTLKLILSVLIISLFVSMISFSSVAAASYRVIGYVYGTPYGIQANKLTHINYAFASIQNGQVFVSNTADLAALVSLKNQNPSLKVILSVGGWGAEGFSDAALTDSSRTIFANSCLSVINANNLDGIDLDWEYPVNGGWGIIKCRPEDKQNFTFLLQKIRNTIGSGKLLTIASGASQEYANNTELNKIAGICDYINIMTYDFGAFRHNANLYESSLFSSTGVSGDLAVRIHINNGVPAGKINLGIPFYGRYGSLWPTYSELVAGYINKNGWTRYWDATAKTCYLQNSSGGFVTYDDPETIGYKTSYIKTNALGGAMFWQYAQDNNGELLTAIWNGLNGGGTNTPTPTPTRTATPTPTRAATPTPTPPVGSGIILSINGNVLSWTDSANGNDYHVYKNGNWIAWTANRTYTISGAVSGNTFYVTNGSGSVKSNTVIYGSTATATPTRSATATPTRVATATPTRTATATPTRVATPTPTPGGYQAWAPNTYYTAGTIVTYGGRNYSCRQSHTSLLGWEPPYVPALWLQL